VANCLFRSLIERLCSNYLFPDLSEHSEKEKITPRIPVMHEETREELYNILVLLCKQVENYAKVIELISDLIPHGIFLSEKSCDSINADHHLVQIIRTLPVGPPTDSRLYGHPKAMLASRIFQIHVI
jgi:hypothetical protein